MKFRTTLLLIALIAAIALGGIMVAAQDDVVSVTLVATSAPRSMDPHGIDRTHPIVLPYILDTLVHQDAAGEIQPYLAESWDVSDDGLTITFYLRDDVLFSNGNPVNADAVIFTFQRLLEVGQSSLIYGAISNVNEFEKVDDYTVTFHLTAPSATLFSSLSYVWGGIIDPEATAALGEDMAQKPVGSGPYLVEEVIPQNSITLVRNPYYNGQRPTDDPEQPSNIDEIVMRFVTDQAARVDAMITGEVDIAILTSAPQLERITETEGFGILDDPSRGLAYLGFNTARAPFDNVLMRRAVAQAVDKALLLDIAAPNGLGEAMDVFIPPVIFGYNPELVEEALTYNPEAAAQLVEEAGYDGSTIIILTSNFHPQPVIATLLQAQLLDIGIDSEIQVVDTSASRVQATAGEFDILITRYNGNDPDALRSYLSAERIGRTNYSAYANPGLDALTAQGLVESDPAVRFEIYTEAQRLIMADMPWVPLYMPINKFAVNTARITGAETLHSFMVLDNAVVGE